MAHFIWRVGGKISYSEIGRKNVNIFSINRGPFKIIIIFLHRFLEDVLDKGFEMKHLPM